MQLSLHNIREKCQVPVDLTSRPVACVGHGGPRALRKIQPNSSYMDIVYKNKLCPLLTPSVPPLETSVPPFLAC